LASLLDTLLAYAYRIHVEDEVFVQALGDSSRRVSPRCGCVDSILALSYVS